MKYDSWDYARQRLDGTVVRANGKVTYLQHIDGWIFHLRNIEDGGDIEQHDIRNVAMDLNPVPLGYVNSGTRSYYLTRQPVRRWKQGLASDSIYVIGAKDGIHVNLGRLIVSKDLAKCINNDYPSVAKAYHMIRHGYHDVAFHREFSLSNLRGKRLLNYKGKSVGYIDDDGLKLNKKFEFLKETLEEAVK